MPKPSKMKTPATAEMLSGCGRYASFGDRKQGNELYQLYHFVRNSSM